MHWDLVRPPDTGIGYDTSEEVRTMLGNPEFTPAAGDSQVLVSLLRHSFYIGRGVAQKEAL